jgi:hypothetical protein
MPISKDGVIAMVNDILEKADPVACECFAAATSLFLNAIHERAIMTDLTQNVLDKRIALAKYREKVKALESINEHLAYRLKELEEGAAR